MVVGTKESPVKISTQTLLILGNDGFVNGSMYIDDVGSADILKLGIYLRGDITGSINTRNSSYAGSEPKQLRILAANSNIGKSDNAFKFYTGENTEIYAGAGKIDAEINPDYNKKMEKVVLVSTNGDIYLKTRADIDALVAGFITQDNSRTFNLVADSTAFSGRILTNADTVNCLTDRELPILPEESRQYRNFTVKLQYLTEHSYYIRQNT